MADAQKPVHPYANRGQRLYHWLDRRTGIGSLLHEALDEPIPGGARWAYVFRFCLTLSLYLADGHGNIPVTLLRSLG